MSRPLRFGWLFAPLLALASLGCRKDEQVQGPVSPAATAARKAFSCLPFGRLLALLPKSVEGFSHAHDEGSSGKYGGVSVSEAERVFRRGETEISLRVLDSTRAEQMGQVVLAGFNATEDDTPNAQRIVVAGIRGPGYLRFDPDKRYAEANVYLADRFIVSIAAREVESSGEVSRLVEQLDWERLATAVNE